MERWSWWQAVRTVWTPSQRIGVALLMLSELGAALAVGTVHATVLCIVTIGLAASCAFLWWDGLATEPRRAATVLLVTSGLLVAYTLFQLAPLPANVVAWLAPRSADVWLNALRPLREAGPAWHPLSLDPIATRIEALRGIAYILAFVATIRAAASRTGVQVLATLIIVQVLIVAVVVLLHPAVGADRVFGVYKPEQPIDERHISPLLNPNPLAAYLNIGICVSFGAALSPRAVAWRVPIVGILIVLVATQLWVASRGGMVALVVGAIVVVVMMRSRAGRHGAGASGLLAVVLIMAGVAMMVLAGSKGAWDELAVSDVSKLALQKQMLPLVATHRWLGVGRGAFESAFPSFRSSAGHFLFTHPEHIVVQWAGEWGVPVALAAFGAIAWSLRPKAVLARSHLAIGPWAALVAAAIHNLVDLNSEVPAVMLLLTTCAALVVAGRGTPSVRLERWAAHPRRVVLVMLALPVGGLLLVGPALGTDLYSDRRWLHELALSNESTDEQFNRAARQALLRHPAEPYLAFTGALRASRGNTLEVVPWAARTIETAPVYGPVHILLARSLRRINPPQARLEYKLAITQAPELTTFVLREAVGLVGDYDDASELVPFRHGDTVTSQLASLLVQRLPATTRLFDTAIAQRDPPALESRTRIARTAVAAIEHRSPWCEESPTACLEAALAAAKELTDRQTGACEGYALRARAVAAAGDPRGATEQLSSTIASLDDPTPCLTVLVKIALVGGLQVQITDAVDRLARAPCALPADCVRNLASAAEAELSRGQADRALTFLRKAYERTPENDAVLERIAEVAARLGLHAEALDAYLRLGKRRPSEERFKRLADRERDAIQTYRRP